ncbi:MAG: glutaredoxin, partial [Patescibacteria group bacterium]
KDNQKEYDLDFYTESTTTNNVENQHSCSTESTSTCTVNKPNDSVMTLPFFGEVDIKETSLFAMSAVLGFIDGFNPCAMWVLLTFLIILSQIGDKKKMLYLVSIFILAESIMYFFILNIWYQTWDFIALDRWVTPAVGLLAVGAGIYFLYKWWGSKGQLTCDVTSFEHQQKTTKKIQDVVSKPITIITTLAVLGIAFSVNIIEFACSVGIAQSFTKILEINDLGFLGRQFYISLYTLFYMVDDFLIFGLAIFGFEKFHTVGQKYSRLSTLIGGILMLILGLLLIFKPDWLMFG